MFSRHRKWLKRKWRNVFTKRRPCNSGYLALATSSEQFAQWGYLPFWRSISLFLWIHAFFTKVKLSAFSLPDLTNQSVKWPCIPETKRNGRSMVDKYSGCAIWFPALFCQYVWQLTRLAWKHSLVSATYMLFILEGIKIA